MTDKTGNQQSYQQLKSELDRILQQLQDSDTDIDKALNLHKQGQEALKKLEAYLKDASKMAGAK